MRQGVNIKSILDFYVVCQRVLPSVTEMIIDSDRKHIITNYSKSKNGGKSVDSDHLTTLLKVNLKVSPLKPLKIEIFNFKDREGKEKFKTNTTQTNEFSECFMSNKPVDSQANDWMKTLITHCNTAFPKIRIRARNIKRSEASDLIDERNILLKTETNDSKEVKILDAKIATILEEEGRSKAYKFKKFCDKDSTLNVTEMWKLKKKIWPKKASALPVAKRDHKGKLISAPADLQTLLQKEYKERLRPRPHHPSI